MAVGVQSENGRRELDPRLKTPPMSDNEAAPVVNKNKRHRKEKRMSDDVGPSEKG